MNLNRQECLDASVGLLRNARNKVNDANILAGTTSYGSASALMITGMEESIKSMFLALDSVGFTFRGRVKGIKSIFNQHGLRYQFAFILSVVSLFAKDVKKLKAKMDNNDLPIDFQDFQYENLYRWVLIKIHDLKKEIFWFEMIGFHREKGMYYDVKSGVVDPTSFSKAEYELVAQRVNGVLSIVEFIHTIAANEKSHQQLDELREKFISENWYNHMDSLAVRVNKNKAPVFDEFKQFIDDLEETLHDETTKELMKMKLGEIKARRTDDLNE